MGDRSVSVATAVSHRDVRELRRPSRHRSRERGLTALLEGLAHHLRDHVHGRDGVRLPPLPARPDRGLAVHPIFRARACDDRAPDRAAAAATSAPGAAVAAGPAAPAFVDG